MTFTGGLLLMTWVIGSILVNGMALLHYLTRLRGLDLVGYGAAAGVCLHALIGCTIAAFPKARWAFVAILIALTAASALYFVFRQVLREQSLALSRPGKVSLALWVLFLVLCLTLLHVDVQFPEPLPDGRYVFKTHTTNVKVQYLTSLPADNYIPFVVAEFFLRGVSFQKERPLLPANEVTNRTILMSLVTLPFRVALGAPHDHPRLGTYNYIGRDWPDVSKLDTGGSFDQFAVIGLVLNSLMLLGLFVFFSTLGADRILPWAALLYLTNPYFIAQTIYTWPKALAGFFVLLAWSSLRKHHSPAVVAALLALACHSHPYAIVFAAGVGFFYMVRWWQQESRISFPALYLLVFGLILAPWIIWTRFVLHIRSDLIMQNLAGSGTEAALASPMSFLWIRLYNLFYLVGAPTFAVYPFNLQAVLDCWEFSLPGIVGLVTIYPALAGCIELPKSRAWLWYGLLGPALLILAIFSCPALPVLHGYQPLLSTLLFFGVWWLFQHCPRTVCIGLVSLQLLFNLSLVLERGLITGARF